MNDLDYSRFIGHCLSPVDVDLAELKSLLQDDGFSWERVIYLSSYGFVTPAFYRALKNKHLLECVPDDAQQYLKVMDDLNNERNSLLYKEMLIIIRQLNRTGVTPLLLKGANALLPDQYTDADARIIGDLDILVPEKMIDACVQCLKEIDYYQEQEGADDYQSHHHAPPLFHSSQPVKVELHRLAIYQDGFGLLSTADMWRDAEEKNLEDTRFFVPSLSARLLHNLIHTQIQDKYYQRQCLAMRPLHEFVQLIEHNKQAIDWQSLYQLMDKPWLARTMETYFISANLFFGLSIPKAIQISKKANWLHELLTFQLKYPTIFFIRHWLRRLKRLPLLPLRLITPSWYPMKYREIRLLWQTRFQK